MTQRLTVFALIVASTGLAGVLGCNSSTSRTKIRKSMLRATALNRKILMSKDRGITPDTNGRSGMTPPVVAGDPSHLLRAARSTRTRNPNTKIVSHRSKS